ncbi:MAG TPA: MFS transporter [Solirubrobacterales bacterium]|nr:MFS transporter [Solirubrobacterales bacterium]
MEDERRRLRFTIIATILGSTVVFLDATVVNVALPAISDDLGTGLADQQWVVEAYLLGLVALLLVGGSLGDQFGRRRIFILGLGLFGATSILCGIAPSSGVLIAARGLQGFAGALLVPGSLAILAATFEGAERGKAVGTWTAWTGIATVIGPAGGGALIEAISWRAIFLVNVPLILVTMWIAHRFVRETVDPEADRHIDWLGIATSAVGLGLPVFALIQEPTKGWGDPVVYGSLIAGIAIFAFFIFWESRYRHAMLDLSLFKVRNFAITNIETLVVYAGLFGAFFFITLFLQQTAGYSPIGAGLATTPVSVVMFLLSPRFGKMSTGIGPRVPMTVGPIIGGIGLIMLTRVGASPNYLTEVLPAILVFGLGLSATVAPLTATALNSVEERHVGVASGINNGVSRVAGLLAIAILGAMIASKFTSTIDTNLAGKHLSPRAERVVSKAKDKPLGTVDTAGLSAVEATTVDDAVTDASTDSFHEGVLVGGLLMILGGVIAGIGLRNPSRQNEYEGPGAATAGECAHCPEHLDGTPRREEESEPVAEPA